MAALAAFTAAPASAATSTVSTDRASYTEGQTAVVSYNIDPAQTSAKNWVALYKAGDPVDGAHFLNWEYVPSASGTWGLTTDGLAAGNYTFDLLYNNTYTVLASASFSVSIAARTVSLDKTAYVQSDTIIATYSTTQVSNLNWIGIYRDTDPVDSSHYLTYQYAPNASDSVSLSAGSLTPGGYVAYFLYNNGYATLLSRPVHFWVTDGTSITQTTALYPALALDKNVYSAGDTITASYRTSSPTSNNWIGIYHDTDPVDSSHYLSWAYAPNSSGAVPLSTSGLAAGGYVAYFLNSYSTSLSGGYSDPVHFWIGSAPQGTGVPALDHVFVVMMENKAPGDIFGTTNNAPNCASPSTAPAPYLAQLACNNVTLTNSHGVHHPSDPNYMALAGGETYLKGNDFPGVTGGGIGSINAPHLGTLVDGASKSWKAYVEGMNGPCDLQTHASYKSDNYDPDNSPFLFFHDMTDSARCRSHLQPLTQLWTDLQQTSTTPNFVWFGPNTWNSMHNGPVSAGDTWLSTYVPTILSSPAFTTQRSLLVITWDEDAAYTAANPIPTIVVGSPGLTKTGFTSNTWYNHYSVTRTVEDGLGLTHNMTANDWNALPFNDVWN